MRNGQPDLAVYMSHGTSPFVLEIPFVRTSDKVVDCSVALMRQNEHQGVKLAFKRSVAKDGEVISDNPYLLEFYDRGRETHQFILDDHGKVIGAKSFTYDSPSQYPSGIAIPRRETMRAFHHVKVEGTGPENDPTAKINTLADLFGQKVDIFKLKNSFRRVGLDGKVNFGPNSPIDVWKMTGLKPPVKAPAIPIPTPVPTAVPV